ncbi:MAG: C39 family peptidase [Planctomycetes bacterium]|nr:C39 family peptidase [Planctomycetota bacterium]
MDLSPQTPTDAVLQPRLIEIERRIADELGIAAEQRAFGMIDLPEGRLACVNGDQMFYGASVPKTIIVFAYLLSNPDVVRDMPTQTLRELQLVIKRSDNELAAKYSQIVGLDRIQQVIQSPEYRFYNRDAGGGMWCGKHYGIDQPRTGDPLADHSHAATVRQCLRYYLLLEQNRLGGRAVCDRLREIFAAPALEFHDDYFVAGLKGLATDVIRKSGTWEDWHLDTARVGFGDRVLLLAGMTRHPRGSEYLERMARAAMALTLAPEAYGADDIAKLATTQPKPPLPYWHHTLIHDTPKHFRGEIRLGRAGGQSRGVTLTPKAGQEALYESAVISPERKFNELLLSWNVATSKGTGMCIEARVGRKFDDTWSPWLFFGQWGDAVPAGVQTVTCESGRIDVDYFRSAEHFDRLQYRVRAAGEGDVYVDHITVCTSDLTGLPESDGKIRGDIIRTAPQEQWQRRLPVPFRSQKTEQPDIAGRICSPTSLSMVMAFYGVERPTLDVARACFDSPHDIYGNWPRNIQAAFSMGVPGYLTRIATWTEAEQFIADGRPLIASIRVEKPGGLTGSPYKTTDGHLLVICGFDKDGNVEVNDPAASGAATGMRTYSRADLAEAWFRGSGGVTYVLLPPSRRR